MRDVKQEIERDLQFLRSKMMAIWDPKTAYGNKELIDILHQIHDVLRRREKMYDGDACTECAGTGEIEHECDCSMCHERYIDCEECGGTGIVDRPDPHYDHMRSPREMANDFKNSRGYPGKRS